MGDSRPALLVVGTSVVDFELLARSPIFGDFKPACAIATSLCRAARAVGNSRQAVVNTGAGISNLSTDARILLSAKACLTPTSTADTAAVVHHDATIWVKVAGVAKATGQAREEVAAVRVSGQTPALVVVTTGERDSAAVDVVLTCITWGALKK